MSSDNTALRRLRPTDLAEFQAYRQDPAIARYQDWEAMSDERAAGFLSFMSTIEPLMRPGHWTQMAISDATTDRLIGDVGLYLSDDGTYAEFGITLAAAHHGQGHAARAANLAKQVLFGQTKISHIIAYADLRNTASRALMKRVGFTQTGTEITDGVDEAVFILHRPVRELP